MFSYVKNNVSGVGCFLLETLKIQHFQVAFPNIAKICVITFMHGGLQLQFESFIDQKVSGQNS